MYILTVSNKSINVYHCMIDQWSRKGVCGCVYGYEKDVNIYMILLISVNKAGGLVI